MFVSDGILDPTVFNIENDTILQNINNNSVTNDPNPEATLISNNNNINKNVHFDGNSIKLDIEKKKLDKIEKIEKEKNNIQTQYQGYKSKKINKQEKQQKYDENQLNNVESNIDSIKNLLNSINKK